MRIGKQDAPFTSICTSDAESITVRGRDLCGDIIGKMDFTSYFWLLVTGEEPTDVQKFFAANHVLRGVSIGDHRVRCRCDHTIIHNDHRAHRDLPARAGLVQPAVAVGVVPVPVRVDDVLRLATAEAVEGRRDPRPGQRDAAVDEQLALRRREHGDVAAGSHQHADAAAHWRDRHLGSGGLAVDGRDR